MTRTRNMADLLDSSGDIKSSALDNVPPSNDASALTTGTLPAARLPATIDGRDVSADGAKLDGIEASATADMTDAQIKTAYENNSDTNPLTDALVTKLNGIETGATADQSASQIKTAYESNSDTNSLTDALVTKLNGIETGANVNQTASEIKTAYESNSDTNSFSDALLSKLNGIAAGATNVTNTNQLTNGAGFVTTDTNTTYSAGNGLSLSGTQFNLGGNAVKQHIMSQPNVGILSKSGGWQEVHTSMRVSIACTSASSRLLIRYTFTFGGNNNSQLAASRYEISPATLMSTLTLGKTGLLLTERLDIKTMMLMTANS